MGIESGGRVPVGPLSSSGSSEGVSKKGRQGKLLANCIEKKVSSAPAKTPILQKAEAVSSSEIATSQSNRAHCKSVLGKRKFSQRDEGPALPASKLMRINIQGDLSSSQYGTALAELQKPEWIDCISSLSSLFQEPQHYVQFLQSPECRAVFTSQIKNSLSSSTRASSDLFDPKLLFLNRLYKELKRVGAEDVLKEIVNKREVREEMPSLFLEEIKNGSGHSISPWDLIEPLCSFLLKHGQELAQEAKKSPVGFAQEKKGSRLPCSVIAFKQPISGEVSLFVTGKILGQGSFKKVKQLITLHESENLAKASVLKNVNRRKAFDDFQKEAAVSSLMQQNSVPHILKIWGVSHGNKVCIMSEICDGGTLLSAAHTMTSYERMRLASQVCEAVAGMHRAGIAHLDLKLENVFVKKERGDLSVRVGDFGAAQKISSTWRQTETGLSSTYPPPEMVSAYLKRRHVPVQPKLDIWSLGVMLFELKHGTKVQKAVHNLSWVVATKNRAIFYSSLRHIHEYLTSSSSDALDRTIASMLSIDPKKRPSSDEVKKIFSQELKILYTSSAPVKSKWMPDWISNALSSVKNWVSSESMPSG